VKLLLTEGKADVSGNGSYKPPLVLAAEKGDLEMCKLLLEHKADPRVPDGNEFVGMPPLYHAIVSGELKVAELLFEAMKPTELEMYRMLGVDARNYNDSFLNVLEFVVAHGLEIPAVGDDKVHEDPPYTDDPLEKARNYAAYWVARNPKAKAVVEKGLEERKARDKQNSLK